MSNFRRNEDGAITAIFTSQESQVLINLTEQLVELLGENALHATAQAEDDPLMNLMGISTNDSPPEDPVLRRLFPDAYEDREDAAEFRRYTEDGLRAKKRAHALMIREALQSAEEEDLSSIEEEEKLRLASTQLLIREEEANAWLGGVNDLRLALAVRLGIETGESEDVGAEESSANRFGLMVESDPMRAVHAVYSWLGWLQESLLEVVMDTGDEHQAS